MSSANRINLLKRKTVELESGSIYAVSGFKEGLSQEELGKLIVKKLHINNWPEGIDF